MNDYWCLFYSECVLLFDLQRNINFKRVLLYYCKKSFLKKSLFDSIVENLWTNGVDSEINESLFRLRSCKSLRMCYFQPLDMIYGEQNQHWRSHSYVILRMRSVIRLLTFPLRLLLLLAYDPTKQPIEK